MACPNERTVVMQYSRHVILYCHAALFSFISPVMLPSLGMEVHEGNDDR